MGRSDRRGPGDASLHLADGVALLRPEEQVFQAMLDGWRNQQLRRNLGFGTVNAREAIVRRFHAFAGSEPWEWSAADVDEFFMQRRAIPALAQSTLLGYQLALRAFLAYLVDPAYGWSEACEERFGTHPTQVCHEWNTARHTQDAIARPKKRALTWEEVQDLFDHADNRVERILAREGRGPSQRFGTRCCSRWRTPGDFAETKFVCSTRSTSDSIRKLPRSVDTAFCTCVTEGDERRPAEASKCPDRSRDGLGGRESGPMDRGYSTPNIRRGQPCPVVHGTQ